MVRTTLIPHPAMALDCIVLPAYRLALATVYDTVTGPDLIEAMHCVFVHPDWETDFDIIWDARGIQKLILAPEDIRAIAAATGELRDRIGTGRSAVVTPRAQDYAPARLLQMRNQSALVREIRVFRSMAEAVEWLAVPGELMQPGQPLAVLRYDAPNDPGITSG